MMVRVSVHFFGELVVSVKRRHGSGKGERLKRSDSFKRKKETPSRTRDSHAAVKNGELTGFSGQGYFMVMERALFFPSFNSE
jgi:hypothetical protein